MSSMVYMYGFGFGGSPGRNVTVHVTYGGAVGSGANVACTNGKKTFYGITDADGNFVFKLTKGAWTITAYKSGSTSTVNAEVTGDCTVDIALFAATIHIRCPAGLSCKVSDGVTTLNAPNTSGIWDFVAPNSGTWNAYLNGTKAGSVSITKSGEEKTLSKWYLYKDGVDNTNLTGGLTGNGYQNGSNWIFGSTNIHEFPNGYAAYFGTNKKISMKNVKKVSAKATLGQNPYNAYLHIGTSKSVNNSVAKATFSGSGNLTVSINASSVTSDCYVFIQDCTYVDIRVNQIWIEC